MIIYRNFGNFTGALGALLALSACSSEFVASTTLRSGATVSMSVKPLFSIHSDWKRRFTISDSHTAASISLEEDTGWWRGSHLYLHSSGTYVVHEGQAGCFGFKLDPVSFEARTAMSCAKMSDAANRLSADNPEKNGYPASKYYHGLFYIGRFIETGRLTELRDTPAEIPVVFQTYEQNTEPELSGIL